MVWMRIALLLLVVVEAVSAGAPPIPRRLARTTSATRYFAVPFFMRWVAGERAWQKLLRPVSAADVDVEFRAEVR